MRFSVRDYKLMELTIKKAASALKRDEYPIAATLVIDNKIIGTVGNKLCSKEDWISHAELLILKTYSRLLKRNRRKKSRIELFTTLEPCLMCLGASVFNRVSRIVFSCPDPCAGATNLNIQNLNFWYRKKWPLIEGGLLKNKSYSLFIKFAERRNEVGWRNIENLFKKMYRTWSVK